MRGLTVAERLAIAARMLRTGRFLARTPYWEPERMRAWQLERIRRLLAHAYGRVPFYKSLYDAAGIRPEDVRTWQDVERLPTVTKDQVIASFPHAIVQSGLDVRDLVVSRSSGSTGKVLDIAYDRTAMGTYVLAGLRLYRMCFRYRPWHRQLYVYTSPYPLDSLFGLYPLRFVHTLAPIAEIVGRIRRVRPALIVCYPSHLASIAAVMEDGEAAALGVRAVSVNSEMSTAAEREALARKLGCPVFDEYSSEELTRIAAQCRHGTYHVFEDVNYVEILDEAGRPTDGTGTVVGTNLHNFAMPMIRYVQNDVARIASSACPCGRRFRSMTGFEGRRNDGFVLPSGRRLSSGFLLDATYEFLLAHRTAAREFCLIQLRPDEVLLQIVPGDGWSADVERAIASRFAGFLEPGVRFRVQAVGAVERTSSGKHNPIVNRTARKV